MLSFTKIYVGILAAFYLHLRPFSQFVISAVDRQIADIDSGKWQPPLAAVADPTALPKREAA